MDELYVIIGQLYVQLNNLSKNTRQLQATLQERDVLLQSKLQEIVSLEDKLRTLNEQRTGGSPTTV